MIGLSFLVNCSSISSSAAAAAAISFFFNGVNLFGRASGSEKSYSL
jgi:hypothetical protein